MFPVGTIRLRKDGNKMRRYIKTDNHKWEGYSVYVAKHNENICGKWFEGCEVHHKDLNCLNDDPHNLICLTKEEHTKIHAQTSTDREGIAVIAFFKGEYFGTFESILKCGKTIGIPPTYIGDSLKGKIAKSEKYDLVNWTFKMKNEPS